MDDLISVQDAAKLLGISYRTVIRLAEAGTIAGKLLSKQWVLSRTSVLEYKQAHQEDTVGAKMSDIDIDRDMVQDYKRRQKLTVLQSQLDELERVNVLPGYEKQLSQSKRNLRRRIARLEGKN